MLDLRYIKNMGALSERDCICLREKSVFVAGCGGLGGYIIDMLLRIGIGQITVADGDVFEPSNLNRQLLCRPDLIGTGKAKAATAYAAGVNSDVRFKAHGEYISTDNVSALTEGCDIVLDALDNIPARRLLKAECDRRSLPYVYGAVGGWIAQAAVSMPGDGLLDALYPGEVSAQEGGTLPFTPAMCAALQCSLCVRLLCAKPVESGKLYCFDLADMEFVKLF